MFPGRLDLPATISSGVRVFSIMLFMLGRSGRNPSGNASSCSFHYPHDFHY